MSLILAAAVREEIARYLGALIFVYVGLIFAHIIVGLIFTFVRVPPYNRALNAVVTFLHDVCEPFLRIFRRFIPMVGPLDLSPIVAILVLQLVGGLIVRLVAG